MSIVIPAGIGPDALLACVKREIKMRERVYPGWIAHGRMKQRSADTELETMRAVLAVLEQLFPLSLAEAPPAPPQGRLF